MSLSNIDVDRFSVGGFGDLRLLKRGPGVIVRWLKLPARAFWNLAAA